MLECGVVRKLYPGLLLLVLLFVRSAHAEPRLVALVEPDVELEHAVSLALSPWNVAAQVTHEESPGTDLPGAARRAGALAGRLHASVIVWVSPSDTGSLLWIYDAERDEVTTRELAEQAPFSSPEAAAVALSLKTILRTTEVAPQAERFGARPASTAIKPHFRRLTLTASGDVRYFSRAATELRGALGGVWWIRAEPPRWGFALSCGTGTGIDVRQPSFSGHFRAPALSAAFAWQVVANRWLASSVYAGGSAHFAELSGFSSAVGASTTAVRVLPSLDLGTELDLSLGRGFQLGLGVRGLVLPRPARYLVQGETVFELQPIAAEFGVRLGLNLL